MNLLLSTCCAPCALTVLKQLPGDVKTAIHFFNPNIHPYKEFERRLTALQTLVEEDHLQAYLETEYVPELFFRQIAGRESNRCDMVSCISSYQRW